MWNNCIVLYWTDLPHLHASNQVVTEQEISMISDFHLVKPREARPKSFLYRCQRTGWLTGHWLTGWLVKVWSFNLRFYLQCFVFLHYNLLPFINKWWARQDLNLRPRAYQARALTNWATGPFSYDGGGNRIRTDDILLAKQALYQLSYTPVNWNACTLRGRLWFEELPSLAEWTGERLNCALRPCFNTRCAIIINKSWSAFAGPLRHHTDYSA